MNQYLLDFLFGEIYTHSVSSDVRLLKVPFRSSVSKLLLICLKYLKYCWYLEQSKISIEYENMPFWSGETHFIINFTFCIQIVISFFLLCSFLKFSFYSPLGIIVSQDWISWFLIIQTGKEMWYDLQRDNYSRKSQHDSSSTNYQ